MLSEPLAIWLRGLLRLGLVLAALGVLPILAVRYVFVDLDPLVPLLLFFAVTPLAVLALLATFILFLAALVRRRPGGPS